MAAAPAPGNPRRLASGCSPWLLWLLLGCAAAPPVAQAPAPGGGEPVNEETEPAAESDVLDAVPLSPEGHLFPREAPKYGSRGDAREVDIEAVRMWQSAIRERVPWFEVDFYEENPEAAVQIVWKRLIALPNGRRVDGELIAFLRGRLDPAP